MVESLLIRLDPHVMRELENQAKVLGMMKAQIVRLAIAEWLGFRESTTSIHTVK
jgi:predicted DNA-binding protein